MQQSKLNWIAVEYGPAGDLRNTERCRCSKRVTSRLSCAVKCCRTPPTPDSVKTGYDLSFTPYFYMQRQYTLLALEKDAEGSLGGVIEGGA